MTHYFEFLNQVDVRNDDVRRTAHVGIDDAVKEVEFRSVFLSVKRRISEAGPRDAYVSFDTTDTSVLRSRNRSDPGSQCQQLSEVSTVQGQILDDLLRDNSSQV